MQIHINSGELTGPSVLIQGVWVFCPYGAIPIEMNLWMLSGRGVVIAGVFFKLAADQVAV